MRIVEVMSTRLSGYVTRKIVAYNVQGGRDKITVQTVYKKIFNL